MILLRNKKILFRKSLSVLPNIFTLGNAFFGFCSIIFSFKGEFEAASYFIFLGALMDGLDGRIARFLGISSDLGLQLDSLSDAISFCLAPAILVYTWSLYSFGFVGILVSATFLLAGVLRLARFNIIHEKQGKFFLGVPTTIAGCFLITFLLNFSDYDYDYRYTLIVMILVLMLSGLMVSRVRFPTFKHKVNFNKNWYILIMLSLFTIMAVLQIKEILFAIFSIYFLSSIFIHFKNNS